MQILKIQTNYVFNNHNRNFKTGSSTVSKQNSGINVSANPIDMNVSNISFMGYVHPKRTIPDIDYNDYIHMKPHTVEFYRRRCNDFDKVLAENEDEIFDKKYTKLPLKSEKNMNEFLRIAKIYTKYKDQPIVCLGRSPKWFLNAALWMKDGIDGYNFVAFSKYWYMPDKVEGMVRKDKLAPNKEEITAYRKYLRRMKSDPKTIVDNFEKNGKKTVITDFIATGKGVTSFLEVMSDYADDLGLLEKFAKSIQIVGIGSMDYQERFYHEDESIPTPEVILPPKLQKYARDIKQEFYNMDYPMFEEMLMNQNTNECRSTYYPHSAWTIYKPDKFKTGMIKDLDRVKYFFEQNHLGDKPLKNFLPKMGDFRNFLQFRILDALNMRGMLK